MRSFIMKNEIVKNLLLNLTARFLSTFQQTMDIIVEQLSLSFSRFYEPFKENTKCPRFCFL